MPHGIRVATGLLMAMTLAVGCTHAQSPVLYPNAKLETAGKAQAEADISHCRQRADEYVSSGAATAKEVGKDTAAGGAGRGAAIGAATGATAGAVHGAVKSSGPSSVYKNFVDRCLREKGYEVIGWQ